MGNDKQHLGDADGIVYLVGAGPGDPGLLTRRASDLLASCDVLVYDALVSPEILKLCRLEAERIYVGKRSKDHSVEQPDINEILIKLVRDGRQVVRLKGGDPYLFGRGAEEAAYLEDNGIRFEIVPGVTAAIAVAAYAGIPVTHREHASSVVFVTGHEDPNKPETNLDWEALSKIGTLCFYMGFKNLSRITSQLRKWLPDSTPVALIEWGTTPRQRSVDGTLSTIDAVVRERGLKAPALAVVGGVVALREKLNFFERRPLFGKRILVTRSRAQASSLTLKLQDCGAEVLAFPTIKIEPPRDPEPLRVAVGHLVDGAVDWVVLTSVNGVDALFGELAIQGFDARALKGVKFAVVGSATATRLLESGVRADAIPAKYVAESIVDRLNELGEFSGTNAAKKPCFLLPRANIASSSLPELLQAHGAKVLDVEAYRTECATEGVEEVIEMLEGAQVDAITFTSASTAKNFASILGVDRLAKLLSSTRLQCFSIGPITTAAMKECQIPVAGEAKTHDIPGLVELVRGALQS